MIIIYFMQVCIYAHMAAAVYHAVNNSGQIFAYGLWKKFFSLKLLMGTLLITLFVLLLLGVYL